MKRLRCFLVLAIVLNCLPRTIEARPLVPLKAKTILRIGETAVHSSAEGVFAEQEWVRMVCEKGDRSAVRLKVEFRSGGIEERNTTYFDNLVTAVKATPFVGLLVRHLKDSRLNVRYALKIVPRDSMRSDDVFKTIELPMRLAAGVGDTGKVVFRSTDQRTFTLEAPKSLLPSLRRLKKGLSYPVRLQILSIMNRKAIRGRLISLGKETSPRRASPKGSPRGSALRRR